MCCTVCFILKINIFFPTVFVSSLFISKCAVRDFWYRGPVTPHQTTAISCSCAAVQSWQVSTLRSVGLYLGAPLRCTSSPWARLQLIYGNVYVSLATLAKSDHKRLDGTLARHGEAGLATSMQIHGGRLDRIPSCIYICEADGCLRIVLAHSQSKTIYL